MLSESAPPGDQGTTVADTLVLPMQRVAERPPKPLEAELEQMPLAQPPPPPMLWASTPWASSPMVPMRPESGVLALPSCTVPPLLPEPPLPPSWMEMPMPVLPSAPVPPPPPMLWASTPMAP